MHLDPQPPIGRPKLGAGPHPGFQNLRSRAGVYRCRLRPELIKRDPRHADYRGILPLTGSKASVLVWVHSDGSLGLRLEKINENTKAKKNQSAGA
jgi:hypothetical protein